MASAASSYLSKRTLPRTKFQSKSFPFVTGNAEFILRVERGVHAASMRDVEMC
jgi:hypothetical protein